MNERLFLVVDGLDGCGKSTLIDFLCNRVQNGGLPFHRYCEPSFGAIGVFLRNLMLPPHTESGRKEILQDLTATALLFAADRSRSIKMMNQSLEAGNHVLCDRWFLSSLVYQTDADPENEGELLKQFNEILSMNKFLLDKSVRLPDLMVFLKIGADAAYERIRRQRNLTWFENDRLMRRQELVWQKAIEFYAKVFERRVIVLDATKSTHNLCVEVMQEITSLVTNFWGHV